MARTWQVNESDCSKIHLLHGSDDNDALWLENTWHEVSPTHAGTMPSDTKMVDSNNQELTLLDGYCTTYFYKGWQTVIPLTNNASGDIIKNNNNYPTIPSEVGKEVSNEGTDGGTFQVVRLIDGIISLPNNMGKNLIPDLYPGSIWRYAGNWKGKIPPLVPYGGQISIQEESFPRTFTIDETVLPAATDRYYSYYAPELFAPYIYNLRRRYRPDGSYLGGIIVLIGVKELS